MKEGQKLWSREELILAMNLYCKLEFGKIHRNNPKVIELARLIGRTPNSVSFKLVNFASFDPSLKARGIKGASNASKLDFEIWNEFYSNWDKLPFESEKLLAKYANSTVEEINKIDINDLPKEGKVRTQLVKVRVNQHFFRSMVMASFNNMCCITGLTNKELLVAGHIRPWGIDEKNRMNPQNGLSLNALHDKAFETGLITILPNFKIKVSSIIKKQINDNMISYFLKYDGQQILMPKRFLPNKEFLEYHNDERFKR